MSPKFALQLVQKMWEFQKRENITSQCICNCKYLYDTVKYSNKDANIKVISVIAKINPHYYCCRHVVVVYNDTIIDPSYEIGHHQGVRYFTTVGDFIANNPTLTDDKAWLKQAITCFIEFAEVPNAIHNDLKIMNEPKYFLEQHKYLETFKPDEIYIK